MAKKGLAGVPIVPLIIILIDIIAILYILKNKNLFRFGSPVTAGAAIGATVPGPNVYPVVGQITPTPRNTGLSTASGGDGEPSYSGNIGFDAFQLKCILGAEQKCPSGFEQNEDAACHPKGPCPEGYHDTDENETGQCYPNSEGCDAHIIKDGIRYDYILLENKPNGKGDRCADPVNLCRESSEDNDHPACKEYLERQEK